MNSKISIEECKNKNTLISVFEEHSYDTTATIKMSSFHTSACERRTESQPQLTCRENFMTYGHVIFETCEREDI